MGAARALGRAGGSGPRTRWVGHGGCLIRADGNGMAALGVQRVAGVGVVAVVQAQIRWGLLRVAGAAPVTSVA